MFLEHKKLLILSSFLYQNLMIISTSRTKIFVLMQNLLGFLLQFTEIGYVLQSQLNVLAKV